MVETRKISLDTRGNCDILDITAQISVELAKSGITDGTVTVFVTGSTAGLTTIEHETGLLGDFKRMWERVFPQGIHYDHDAAWGEANGHSHVRASILGPSLTIPFVKKKMTLGTWQQVVLVDFDVRSRSREIVLQLIGD